MKRYHPTECIFDMLASQGPQEVYDLCVECCNQCTTDAFTTTIGAGHVATDGAINTLVAAGLIESSGPDEWQRYVTYDLTDYGYIVLSCYSDRQRDYEAHQRTL